jgi:hypothetical protein
VAVNVATCEVTASGIAGKTLDDHAPTLRLPRSR